jgi:glycosyltransferase involved in cell wall biosynthesis
MPERTQNMVSVIMPCYNAREHIAHAIDSVLSQTYPYWELIIVDDGSTDGSHEIIESYAIKHSDRIHSFHQKNSGSWHSRNFALRRSRGAYIACLDSDDYWRKDFFEKMLESLSANTAKIAYCGWQNFGTKAPSRKPYIPPDYEEDDPLKAFLVACPWPIHAALTPWIVFEELGLFSERYLRSMDYDFWLRTLAVGMHYRRVAHVLAFYRWEGQHQLSDSKAIQALNTQNIRESFIRDHPQLVAHIGKQEMRHLISFQSKTKAYELYWAGDMKGARLLFKALVARGALSIKDFRYVFIALLPEPVRKTLRLLRAIIFAVK